MPIVQPRPRKVSCSTPTAAAGSGSSRARSRPGVRQRGDVLTPRRPEQGERRGGEPGLDHRPLVGEGQIDDAVRRARRRRSQVAEDDRGRDPTLEPGQHLDDLRGRPGPGQRDHPVVRTVRHLGSGERVGLAAAGGLAKRGKGLADEPGRTTTDEGDPFAVDAVARRARSAPVQRRGASTAADWRSRRTRTASSLSSFGRPRPSSGSWRSGVPRRRHSDGVKRMHVYCIKRADMNISCGA